MSVYLRFDEAWERRKAYLFRSLFEDPELSVIREEEEDSSPRVGDTRTLAELEESSIEDQDEGSLPELIIEVEKKRTYDESPEFYKKLEILMKSLIKKYLSDATRTVARQEDFITDSNVSSAEELSEKSKDVHSAIGSNVTRTLSDEVAEADGEDQSKAESEEETTNGIQITSDVNREETYASSVVRSPEMVRRRSSNDVADNDIPLKKITSSESPTPRPDASSIQSEEDSSAPLSGDALASISTSESEGGVDLPITADDEEVSAESRQPSPSSPNEFHYGHPSPLPEVVIEVDAKQTNDEPDEFYDKLKILMKGFVIKYLLGDEKSKATDAREESKTDSDVSNEKSQDVHSASDSNDSKDISDENGNDEELDDEQFEAEPEQGATDELAITTDASREKTRSIVLSPEIMRRRKSDSNDIIIPEKRKKSTNSTTPREVSHDIELDSVSKMQSAEDEGPLPLLSDVAGEATPKSGGDALQPTSTEGDHLTSTSGTDVCRTSDKPVSERHSGRNILNNLFVGTPTIFKLCSCIDHECS